MFTYQLVDVLGIDTAVCQFDSLLLADLVQTLHMVNAMIYWQICICPYVFCYYVVEGYTFNGCINSDSVYITVHNLPNVNAGVDTSICDGDSLLFLATGAVSHHGVAVF